MEVLFVIATVVVLEGLIWWLSKKLAKANKRDYDAAVAEKRARPKAGLFVLYGTLLIVGVYAVPIFGLMFLLR